MSDESHRMAQALRAHGYKLTAPRLAVLAALAGGAAHLSAAQVCQRGRAICPTLGLTTVYRTLEILTRLGFLHRPFSGEGLTVYNTHQTGHHGHLVCAGCGQVVELGECYLGEVAQKLMDETHFRIDSHLLEFSGLCPACRAAEDRGDAPHP
ncbi:MAG: transcriptional repressor [Chloroflexi bacterium]|nr:transcriptional repressor [Chloroflexota bacterium]